MSLLISAKWLMPAIGGLWILLGGCTDGKTPNGPVSKATARVESPAMPSSTQKDSAKQDKTPSSHGESKMSVAHGRPSVQHANDATFDALVLKSKVPVLVDFYADWCGPCQMLGPVLDELAAENPGTKIVKVNVDHSPDLAYQYGISAIPNLKVFKNGTVKDELVGMANKAQLQALLRR